MIKKIIENRKQVKAEREQKKLLESLTSKKSLEKAAEGSMEKRNQLINRVNAKPTHA